MQCCVQQINGLRQRALLARLFRGFAPFSRERVLFFLLCAHIYMYITCVLVAAAVLFILGVGVTILTLSVLEQDSGNHVRDLALVSDD